MRAAYRVIAAITGTFARDDLGLDEQHMTGALDQEVRLGVEGPLDRDERSRSAAFSASMDHRPGFHNYVGRSGPEQVVGVDIDVP